MLLVRLTLSRLWKWGEGSTDTRTECTRSDYEESLIVCVLYCDNAEGKGESLAASLVDFLQGWFESEERRLLFFSFWCLGCSEPVLYQHGCRMQIDTSLGRLWTYVHKDQLFLYLSLLFLTSAFVPAFCSPHPTYCPMLKCLQTRPVLYIPVLCPG